MNKRAPRSRNGCAKCKDRVSLERGVPCYSDIKLIQLQRLKCDETRPACHRCQQRNLTCPGYTRVVRWSDKHELHNTIGGGTLKNSAKHVEAQQSSISSDSSPSVVQNPSPTFLHFSTPPVGPLGLSDDASVDNFAAWSDTTQLSMDDATAISVFRPDMAFHADLANEEFWNALTVPWFSEFRDCNVQLESTSGSNDVESHIPEARGEHVDVHQGQEGPSQTEFAVNNDDAEKLLQHYFSDVCRINSIFDSPENPLRYLVDRYVRQSPLVRNCVLGIFAVHLMQGNDQLQRQVIDYHSAAINCLARAVQDVDNSPSPRESAAARHSGSSSPRKYSASSTRAEHLQGVLLALLLIGVSASWLDPSCVGITHLLTARLLFSKWAIATADASNCKIPDISTDREASFIVGAMAYWESTISFVVDQPLNSVDYLLPFCQNAYSKNVFPNPWTGISTPIFIVLARTGICVRQKHAVMKLQSLGWATDVYENMLEKVLETATEIAQFSISYSPPARSQVQAHISLNEVYFDLESLAQIYKLATLLEIYRSFPEIAYNTNAAMTRIASVPSQNDSTINRYTQSVTSNPTDRQEKLLFRMAIDLLGLIKETKDFQATSLAHTLAILISGSTLYCSSTEGFPTQSPISTTAYLTHQIDDLLHVINMRPSIVKSWRTFVHQRIQSNAEFVGLDSFKRVQLLLEEIWSRLDQSHQNNSRLQTQAKSRTSATNLCSSRPLHWMDVMTECRLETIFG